jgi:hypothetical protein
MPPWYYVILHPPAKLSAGEKDELVRGLSATFGQAESEPDCRPSSLIEPVRRTVHLRYRAQRLLSSDVRGRQCDWVERRS